MSDELQEALEVLHAVLDQHISEERLESDGVRREWMDSGFIGIHAVALRLLARHGRIKIIDSGGRVVVGFPLNQDLPLWARSPEKLQEDVARAIADGGAEISTNLEANT